MLTLVDTSFVEHTTDSALARADVLAQRFLRANERAIAEIARYPERRWTEEQGGLGWSAAAEARHLAQQYVRLAGFIAAVAKGRPLPTLPHERLQSAAAQRSRRGGMLGRETAMTLLRHNGAAAAGVIRGLDDEQLERATSCFGTKLTAAQLVDESLIAHVEEHGGGLRHAA